MRIVNLTPNPVVIRLHSGSLLEIRPLLRDGYPTVVYAVKGWQIRTDHGVIHGHREWPQQVDGELPPKEHDQILLVDEAVARALPARTDLYYPSPHTHYDADGESYVSQLCRP